MPQKNFYKFTNLGGIRGQDAGHHIHNEGIYVTLLDVNTLVHEPYGVSHLSAKQKTLAYGKAPFIRVGLHGVPLG
jgi:hypothetical protein